jgi:hypothetical protein
VLAGRDHTLKTGLVIQNEDEGISSDGVWLPSFLATIPLRKALWWKLRLMVCDEMVIMGR